MVPLSVISCSASMVSKGARKLKKKVSNLIESISSGKQSVWATRDNCVLYSGRGCEGKSKVY
jgi:phage-related protein